MEIGLSIPQIGSLADPPTIATVAVAAEAAGYHSLWALDRLMAPVRPRSDYPGTPDGSLPPQFHTVLDPLLVLGQAAAVTGRVRLGTNVLVAPWYPPVLLARSLTTLDHLSGGRLDVGLGLGWSEDECDAVGVPRRGLGRRMEEILDVLECVWRSPVVRHDGAICTIAETTIEPKPLQEPRPPLLLAGFTPAGLERIARRADGWLPVGLPHDVLGSMWAAVRDMAAGHGRDPDDLQLIVRANVHHTDRPIPGDDRPVFVGSLDQIAADLVATEELGAHELVLDLFTDAHTGDELLDLAAAITAAAGHRLDQPVVAAVG